MQVNDQSQSNKLNSTQNLLITVLEVLARALNNECVICPHCEINGWPNIHWMGC